MRASTGFFCFEFGKEVEVESESVGRIRKKEIEKKHRRTDVARLAEQNAVFDRRLAFGAGLAEALDFSRKRRDFGVDVEHGGVLKERGKSKSFFFTFFD